MPVIPLDHIQDIINNFHNELEGIAPMSSWKVGGPIGNSRKCDIYMLSNPQVRAKLALKIYRQNTVSAKAPQAQYDALKRAHITLACPKPHGFHLETGAILMDWIDAPRLRQSLWRSAMRPQRQLHLVKRAGVWLRKLHGLSELSHEPIDAGKLISKLDIQLEKHETAERLLRNDPAFLTVLKTFNKTAGSLEGPHPHVFLHGDFTPSNMLVQNLDVVGIDIWGARRGPIYEDIARMLTYLAIVSPFSLTANPLHTEAPLPKAFIKGYGADWLQVDTKAWHAVLLYQQLRRWIVYQERTTGGKQPVVSRWLLSRTKNITMQTHSWLEHCLSEA